MDICLICLRTDKLLKLASNALKEFHDEMCDFSISMTSCHYCNECEYIMTKFYEFKEKCVIALKAYKKWKSTKATKRQPLNLLHTLLPPSPADDEHLWTPDKIDQAQATEPATDSHKKEELRKNRLRTEVKLEIDHAYSNDINSDNSVKIENLSEDKPKSEDNKEIKDNSEAEHSLSDNFEETVRDQSGDEITDANISKHMNDINDKKINNVNSKKHKKATDGELENLPKRNKRLSKKNASKRQVHNEKFIEEDEPIIDELADEERTSDEFGDEERIDANVSKCMNDMNDKNINSVNSKKHKKATDGEMENLPKCKKRLSKKVSSKRQGHSDKLIDEDEPIIDQLGDEERTDANISECMNDVNDKKINIVNSKTRKNTTDGEIENLPKRKKGSSKKVASKRQAHNDKLVEEDKQYESLFDIKYLTTDEMQLEEFERRKTYVCYVKADYKCDICYQVFKTENFLKYHTKKWHNESPGSIYCTICKIWSSKTSHHKVTHTVVFKCKLCTLVTYHRESMHNHFEWHNGKHYRCEECNITCKSKSAYRSHLGKEHRKGCNICESCGRGFLSPRGLTIHKHNSSRCTGSKEQSTVSMENKEGVRCGECNVTLPSQEIYDAHIYDVHEPRRRTFTTNSAGLPGYMKLSQKVRKVQQERRAVVKHTCRVCNADGVSFAWLQLHFKREHPNDDLDILYADKRTHLCDICGTGFGSAYGLRDHMNIHTGARPYACEMCPKRFRSAHLKRAHRVRHFPSTLSCNICGKQFKTKGNLYWHMKIHTGEKNHKCDICGKGFLYSGNLEEHVRGVHYNLRRVKKGGTREGADTGGKRAKKGDAVNKTTEQEFDKFRSDNSE